MLANGENWIELTDSNTERYQYPGWHDSCIGNILYYSDDITKLPHYNDSDPHFVWSDIQLSKASTSKIKLEVTIRGKTESLLYWISDCKGVKRCHDCDHVVHFLIKKNNSYCKEHPTAKLVREVHMEFVHVYPSNPELMY